jgi:hypothetical protein
MRRAARSKVQVMSTRLGTWLRGQRQARSWNVPEMTRQLRRAATEAGDVLPDNECLYTMIRRWERGTTGVSERYMLHYCRALGIEPDRFGPPGPVTGPLPGVTGPPALPALAYRWTQEPEMGDHGIEHEVVMAAHEGSDHAEHTERRDIGDATLEQMRADVTRLSRAYMNGEPLALFLEMRRVRARMYAALDRRLWPRDQTDLYFLLGCINGLMAIAANGLGYPQAADELTRSGWAYAAIIDYKPLMAKLRMEAADQANWHGQFRQAREWADNGRDLLPRGRNAALMLLTYARATARIGDVEAARDAIAAASDAFEADYQDDVLEIGGEFDLSRASLHYYAGSTFIAMPGSDSDAIGELERASALYAAGPGPGEDHSHYCELFARTDLATARLRAGQLDGAVEALAPVMTIPPANRIELLPRGLAAVRAELAKPRYQGSAQASALDEQIENFDRETVVAGLKGLSGGPA